MMQSTVLGPSLYFLFISTLSLANQPHVHKEENKGFLPINLSYGAFSLLFMGTLFSS
jgi:hypothetical protein